MDQRIRQTLARWRETFFAQKYRFDLGQSFLTILNFTLLVITASDKLMIFFGIPRLRSLMSLILPLGFLGVWLFGLFMDHVRTQAGNAERQSMLRSEVWRRHNDQMDRMERDVTAIKSALVRRRRR